MRLNSFATFNNILKSEFGSVLKIQFGMGNIVILFGQKLYNFSSNRRIAFPGLLHRKLICQTVTRVIWDTKMQLSIFN